MAYYATTGKQAALSYVFLVGEVPQELTATVFSDAVPECVIWLKCTPQKKPTPQPPQKKLHNPVEIFYFNWNM